MIRQLVLCVALCAVSVGGWAREFVVGFAQDAADNEWRLSQAKDLGEAFARLPNIRFEVSVGGGSSAQQIVNIENFLQRKVDLLIVSPRDAALLAPVIARVYQAGIPVVLTTRRVEGDAYTVHIGPDDEAIGRSAAQLIAKRLKGSGNVVMLEGNPSTSTSQARTRGFTQELAKHKGIRLTATLTANYQRSEAIREIENLLQKGTPFDAIFAQNDTMASGARLALKQGGRDPRTVLLVGIDYLTEAREAILSGEQTASFIYPTSVPETVNAVQRLLAGEKVPKRMVVPAVLIDSGNVEQFKKTY